MMDFSEIKKSQDIKIETLEILQEGINKDSITILSTNNSPEVSKGKGSKSMAQDTRIPYCCYPNYTGHQQSYQTQINMQS